MTAPASTSRALPRARVEPDVSGDVRGPRWSRPEKIWVVALVLFVAALGAWRLGRPTFWNDEAATWAISGHGFGDLWHVLSSSGGDRGAALYYVVALGWMRIFGTTESALRSLSVLVAAAALVPFHAVARRVVSRPAAWAAGAIFASSSFLVAYARDARTYSFALLLVLLAGWTFLRAVESASSRDWWIFVAVALVAVYAHWFSALVVVALFVSLLFGRRPLGRLQRPVLRSAVALAIGMVPIAAQVVLGANGGVDWVAPLSLAELRVTAAGFTGTNAPFLEIVVGALLVLGILTAWSERRTRPLPPLPLTWFVFPVAVTIACSTLKPLLVTRYLIVALPGFALLLGMATARLARGRILVTAVGVALVAGLGLQGYRGLWATSRGGEDWRSVVEAVASDAAPSDAIVVFPATAVSAFSYYARHRPQLLGRVGPDWPPVRWDSGFTRSVTNGAVLRADVGGRSAVWLVVRAPHGDTVARTVRESPVLTRLERRLSGEYRLVTVVPPWGPDDTVYVIRYSDPTTK